MCFSANTYEECGNTSDATAYQNIENIKPGNKLKFFFVIHAHIQDRIIKYNYYATSFVTLILIGQRYPFL